MTGNGPIELSRRRVLGGLGAVGVASAGAALGTSAYFSDEESFDDNVLTAGSLDLLVDYYSYWDQGMAGMGSVSGTADGEAVAAELGDVKPGDNGLIALCPRIDDNPAYLWLAGELTANDENGQSEPEAEVDDSGGDPGEGNGELAESIDLTVSYCDVADEVGDEFDPDDADPIAEIWTGSLEEFLEASATGFALDGNANVPEEGDFPAPGDQACFDGTSAEESDNPCLCIDWEIPTDVGNEIQTDSVAFDLQLYAEQCRHNDGTDNPYAPDFPEDPWLSETQTDKGGVFWNHSGDDNEFPLSAGDTFDDLPDPGQPIYVNTTDQPITVPVDDGQGGTSVSLDVGAHDGSDFHDVGSNAPWVRIPTGIGTPHPSGGDNYEFIGIQETNDGFEVEWQPVS